MVAYGCALPMPFLVCLMSIVVLCKPGPPKPLLKGVIGALIFAALVAAGVLMVPLLEHYALSRHSPNRRRCSTGCSTPACSAPIR